MGCHWHAVERDLIALGFRADDIGTPKLTLWELISIVLAAPPGSAVHHQTGGWDKTSEMVANLAEQQAGLISFRGRWNRPGVDSRIRSRGQLETMAPYKGIRLDVHEGDPVDFQRKLRERQEQVRRAKEKT